MLTKVVVNLFASFITLICEIGIWLLLIVSLISGWQLYGFKGALLGLAVGFFFAVFFFGGFLMLIDIRKAVKAIEGKNQTLI